MSISSSGAPPGFRMLMLLSSHSLGGGGKTPARCAQGTLGKLLKSLFSGKKQFFKHKDKVSLLNVAELCNLINCGSDEEIMCFVPFRLPP